MNIFQEAGDRIAKAFKKGDMTRNRKREIERTLKKRGASQEQIDYAIFLDGNQQRAKEIYESHLKLLNKLGFDLYAKVTWHEGGANAQITLSPMDMQTFKQAEQHYKAQEEAERRQREKTEQATAAEDKTSEGLAGEEEPEDATPKAPQVFTIIANSRPQAWSKDSIGYEEAVDLALEKVNPKAVYTVAYHTPDDRNGTLTPESDRVEVVDKMIINVSLTNNA